MNENRFFITVEYAINNHNIYEQRVKYYSLYSITYNEILVVEINNVWCSKKRKNGWIIAGQVQIEVRSSNPEVLASIPGTAYYYSSDLHISRDTPLFPPVYQARKPLFDLF